MSGLLFKLFAKLPSGEKPTRYILYSKNFLSQIASHCPQEWEQCKVMACGGLGDSGVQGF